MREATTALVGAALWAILAMARADGEPATANCGLSSASAAPQTDGEVATLRGLATPESQYRLALASATGRVVPRDCRVAVALLQRAANLRFAPAENALGEMLEAGTASGAPDARGAAKWYRTAADQEEPMAEYNLGRVIVAKRAFEYGPPAVAKPQPAWGFADDLQSAHDDGRFAAAAVLWEKSAAAGNALAMYDLGKLFASGRGVRQDKTRAATLFRRAADAGIPGAQDALNDLRRPAS